MRRVRRSALLSSLLTVGRESDGAKRRILLGIAGFRRASRVGQGRAATTIRPTIWEHYRHTNLVRIASSLRADMIFGKDRPQSGNFLQACHMRGNATAMFDFIERTFPPNCGR